MYMLLTLALVCTAAASSGYGASYGGPSHSAPSYGANHGYGYGGYGGHYVSDSSDSRSSERRHHKCRKPKELEIPASSGYTGTKPRFSFLERKGKSYIKLSCPDDGKAYILVGDQEGFTDTFSPVPDVVYLAEGANIDLVGRCKGKRIEVDSINKGHVKVKKVACVWLKNNEITTL